MVLDFDEFLSKKLHTITLRSKYIVYIVSDDGYDTSTLFFNTRPEAEEYADRCNDQYTKQLVLCEISNLRIIKKEN